MYLDNFALNSYNFLDLLVEMFWVVLISYFGSLELYVGSTKGDGLVNLGGKLVDLASKFSKIEHMEVFLHVFSISPIGFLTVVGGIRPQLWVVYY